MSEAASQLLPDVHELAVAPALHQRRELPASELELIEYSSFPRRRCDQQGWQVGFVRRLHASGLRLEIDEAEIQVGSLLRVLLRDADGRPTLDAVARVAWAIQDRGARLTLGLSILADLERGLARARTRPSSGLPLLAPTR